MKKLITICILCLSVGANADTVINKPALHENIIAGITWTDPIAHAYGYPSINCNSSDSNLYSQCWLAFSETQHLPLGASSINVTIKAKVWYKGGADISQCLIYAYVLKNSTEIGNHFIHTETFSLNDTTRQSRRISYINLDIPVVNGKVAIGVGKMLKSNCSVDFVVYLDGYKTNE